MILPPATPTSAIAPSNRVPFRMASSARGMARIAGYATRPHPAGSGDYDEGMTSDKRPRVFVARIIPDEGLQPIIAQTDADVLQDQLPPTRAVLLPRGEGV